MTNWVVRAVDDEGREDEDEDEDEEDKDEDEEEEEEDDDDGEDVRFAGFTEAELAAQDLLFAQDVLSEEDLRTEGTDHRCGARAGRMPHTEQWPVRNLTPPPARCRDPSLASGLMDVEKNEARVLIADWQTEWTQGA